MQRRTSTRISVAKINEWPIQRTAVTSPDNVIISPTVPCVTSTDDASNLPWCSRISLNGLSGTRPEGTKSTLLHQIETEGSCKFEVGLFNPPRLVWTRESQKSSLDRVELGSGRGDRRWVQMP
eukprot:774466-Pyramimonas_sp.AAC.1